ncbi:hypothetical protein ELG88_08405 [Rhizobium leguminosarum]|uniref:hypothetical protein n=1 Tax=Rhizobium leguminosarum TaxID=384 RepID=UPI0010326CA8|nr:hypothetical protein [Rhizobium leguminosarum]TBF35235.1 hypothetical protein ELG88_08405 [Rhizobium leguminosarum]
MLLATDIVGRQARATINDVWKAVIDKEHAHIRAMSRSIPRMDFSSSCSVRLVVGLPSADAVLTAKS